MIQIFFIVLPIFLVLLLGNILKKTNLIDDHFIMKSNRLIFNVCLPVLLFYKISQADIGEVFSLTLILIMLASVAVIFVLSIIVSFLLKFPGDIAGTFAMNNFRANYAYMGLPVSSYAYGDEGLIYASVLMAFIVPFVNLMSVAALSMYSGAKTGKASFMKNTLLNPLAVACLLGLFVAFFQIPMAGFMDKTLQIIAGVTLPLALFCVGASLSLSKLRGEMLPVTMSGVFKLILTPVAAFVLIRIFMPEMTLGAKVLIIMLAAPSATVNYVLAESMGGNGSVASSTIVATTIFSIITFIAWLAVLGV